ILDTYEIIDRVDFWIRLVIRASGPRVIWIICGRDNLTRSRQFGEEYFKGYADEWPRRLYSWDLHQLAQDDVKKYFAVEAPAYPIDETEIERISRATRGIPLAIREAAEMLRKGISVDEIVSGIDDLRPADEIVREMTARYLLHAAKNENDHRPLFPLPLARGDRDVLRAMLRRDTVVEFDLTARLAQLERHYASVHFKEARLQDEPSFFLHERLRSMRDEGWVNKLNQHAVDAIRRRMARREE